jgi:hypothetical protein
MVTQKIRAIDMCLSSSRKCWIFSPRAIEMRRKLNIGAECDCIANSIHVHIALYNQSKLPMNIWTAKIYVVFKIIGFVFLYMHATKFLF